MCSPGTSWRYRANYSVVIIIYYDVFLYFFQFKELFSKRCSIISCVVQGLVEICKKYMEVNLFLLLTLQYSYIIVLIDCIVFLSSLVVLVEVNLLEWQQLFSREVLWWVCNFLQGSFSWGQLPGGQSSMGQFSWRQLSGHHSGFNMIILKWTSISKKPVNFNMITFEWSY